MTQQRKKRAARLRRAGRFCQQAYCWRYVDHAQVDAGGDVTERGYGVLAMVAPHQVDAIQKPQGTHTDQGVRGKVV